MRRQIAGSDVDAALRVVLDLRLVHVDRRRLARFRIDELLRLRQRGAVLAPDRVGERELRGAMPHHDHDGDLIGVETVAVLVPRKDIAGKLQRVLHAVRRCAVEDEPVFSGQLHPVVSLVTIRLEPAYATTRLRRGRLGCAAARWSLLRLEREGFSRASGFKTERSSDGADACEKGTACCHARHCNLCETCRSRGF